MVGLETSVTDPVRLVALHASNIIQAHVSYAVKAYMGISVKENAVEIVKQ